MPLELSESLKNTYGFTFASRGLNGLFCNKFYTTVILTIIILIIITIIYPCKKGTPVWIVGKVGLYIFMATITILFIHDSVTNSMNAKITGGYEDDEFVESLGGNNNIAFNKDNIQINPNFDNISNDSDENNKSSASNADELFKIFGV